jgi:hypothetical protein
MFLGVASILKIFLNSPQAKLMRLSIGTKVLDAVANLGQDALKLMRAFGSEMQAGQIQNYALPDKKKFENALISGLKDSNGTRFDLSPEVLLGLAKIFQISWKATLINPAFDRYSPGTASLLVKDKASLYDLPRIIPNSINYDALTSLFLCRRLAEIPEKDFQDLLNLSLPGNPQNLDLKFARSFDNIAAFPEVIASGPIDCRASSDLFENSEVSLILPHAAERILICETVDRGITELRLALEKREESVLMPTVLYKIENSSRDWDQFYDLCQSLRDLRKLREQFILAVSLSADVLFVSRIISDPRIDLLTSLKVKSDPHVSKLIMDLEYSYAERLFKLAGNPDSRPLNEALILISDLESFAKYSQDIGALIDSTKRSPEDPEFREKGGIVHTYYDKAFWRDFFESSGKLFVALENERIMGFVFNFTAGATPRSSDKIPEEFRPSRDARFSFVRSNT